MSPLQKDAVFGLMISVFSVGLFIILLFSKNFQISFSAFAILGIYGLTPWLFYRKGGKRVLFDERDKEIANRGNKVGFWAFWLAFTAVSVLVALVKGEGAIPAASLTYAVMGGMIIIITGRAITVLALYRQGKQA
jgi:hypothetical protein